jgi:hypothetical protein
LPTYISSLIGRTCTYAFFLLIVRSFLHSTGFITLCSYFVHKVFLLIDVVFVRDSGCTPT